MMESIKIAGYTPPRYSKGKEFFIEYRVVDPIKDKVVRKRIKLNHIKGAKTRDQYANHVMRQLSEKLASGWNPMMEERAPKAFTSLTDAFAKYLDVKEREGLRPHTLRSYQSQGSLFLRWYKKAYPNDRFVVSVERRHALQYLNHLFMDKECAAQTWNNHLMFMRGLFTWFIEQEMCATNPFAKFKSKRTPKKRRRVISMDERDALWANLESFDHRLCLITKLIYYCLLRPKEIGLLKPSDFDLENQTVRIDADVAKSGRTSHRTIPDAFMPEVRQMVEDCPKKDWYLFASRIQPSETPRSATTMQHRFRAFREHFELGDEVMLYSFKDSGIVHMIQQQIPLNTIMKQADHTDLDMTKRYADHLTPEAVRAMKGFD